MANEHKSCVCRFSWCGSSLRAILAVLVLGATLISTNAQTPQSVGTVYAELKDIAKSLEFVGRVEAIDRVVVLARVKGYLESVQFKAGDVVKKGDPLYQIEKSLF
jgi:membrane fusion protein (multidrug efflux system)